MRFRFTGEFHNGRQSHEWFGYRFTSDGAPVDVTDVEAIKAFSGHPEFEQVRQRASKADK